MLHYRPGEASNSRGFAKGRGGRASHDAADARRMEIALVRSGAGHGVPSISRSIGPRCGVVHLQFHPPEPGAGYRDDPGLPPLGLLDSHRGNEGVHFDVGKRADSEGGVGNGGDAFRSTWGRDVLGSTEVKRSRCPRAKLQEARLVRWTYRLQVASTTRLIGK